MEDNVELYQNSVVYDDANLSGNVKLYNRAEVFGKAKLSGDVKVTGTVKVSTCVNIKNHEVLQGEGHVTDVSFFSVNNVANRDGTLSFYPDGKGGIIVSGNFKYWSLKDFAQYVNSKVDDEVIKKRYIKLISLVKEVIKV